MNRNARRRTSIAGFTLIELMVTAVIVAVLAGVALPAYTRHIVRGSRQAAQSELTELAALQEKIFLNSSAYAASVTTAYNGRSDGGLGVTSGLTQDSQYTLSVSPTTPGPTYTLVATPVAGSRQRDDGAISLSSNGVRLWGTVAW